MGSWGTGISSNDTFEDIRDEFFYYYDEGQEPADISLKLIKANSGLVNDREEANHFWFALALCQWECKSLEPELLEQIIEIVSSGADIELWKELGAERSELTKRQKVLDKFLAKLQSEKKSPRKRKKKVFRDAIFKKGDCLSVELSDGSFGAAYVLEAEYQTTYGMNLIALCNYQSDTPPTIQYFEKANVLISKQQASPGTFKDYPLISWYMAIHFKPKEVKLKVIGTIESKKNYNQEKDYSSFVHWKYLPIHIEDQPEMVAQYGPIQTTQKLKSLRKRTWL